MLQQFHTFGTVGFLPLAALVTGTFETFVILPTEFDAANIHGSVGGYKKMSSPANTRRWPRHPVELAVLVVPRGGDSKFAIPGRGIEISEGGMTLYAGLPLKPGDFMDLEFQTPGRTRISAIVRNRTGYCFGLEFLTPLGAESPKPSVPASAAPQSKADLRTVLKRKEREIERLRSEISTLKNYGRSAR